MGKIIIKRINIVPDISLMPKMGKTGYSVAQAISELIDNGLDARFENKPLNVAILFKKDFIEIDDDGRGMSEKEAAQCLKLAYSEKQGELGEFGLGLKTAALSLGKYFKVTTTQRGSKKEFNLAYDETDWLNEGKWESHPMEINSDSRKNKSGTRVHIDKLIIKYYPNLITRLRDELAIRYSPFISNKLLNLRINGRLCKPKEPELDSQGKETIELKLDDGNIIRGWRGLLRVGSNKGYYGFNTFRRGRLITQFDKIGFDPHPEVRQIIGELHLDHLPVTHNKREFIKESYIYQAMEEAMRKFMKPFVAKARKSISNKAVDEKIADKMNDQLEVIAQALNKIPELKLYSLPLLKNKAVKENSLKKTIAKIEVEERDTSKLPIDELFKLSDSQRKRKPRITHKRKRCVVLLNGKKYKFSHQFRNFQDPSFWKDKVVSEDNGVEVFTNTAFPAFEITQDQIFYATMHVAEAIAEVAVEQKGEEKGKIFGLRDAILRESSLITTSLKEVKKIKNETEKLKEKITERKKQISNLHKKLGF